MNMKPQKRRNIVRIGIAIIILLVIVLGVVLAYRKPAATSTPGEGATAHTAKTGAAPAFIQQSDDMPLYVLVVGVDKNVPQQANFVGLAAINKAKQHIDFMMIPDNTKIEGRKEKGIQDLQSVYSEGGLPLLQAVVEDVVHLPIPYYVVFTTDAFTNMIDLSGGLPLYVEENMYHADAQGTTDINLLEGYQRLTGAEATGYMRYIDDGGYIGRTLRQERLVKLFYEDRQLHFGVANAFLMYRFWHQVDSNISTRDMADLAWSFRNVPVDNLHFYILPGEMAKDTESQDYYSTLYWTYDPVEVQKIIGKTNNSVTAAPTAGQQIQNT